MRNAPLGDLLAWYYDHPETEFAGVVQVLESVDVQGSLWTACTGRVVRSYRGAGAPANSTLTFMALGNSHLMFTHVPRCITGSSQFVVLWRQQGQLVMAGAPEVAPDTATEEGRRVTAFVEQALVGRAR